jgi:hypothetical protein
MQELFPGTNEALNNLSLYKAETPVFEDVSQEVLDDEIFMETMDHFDNMKAELGMVSIWSIYDAGCKPADWKMFSDKARTVRYQFIRPDATMEELHYDIANGTKSAWAEVTMVAVDGTIGSLWFAANSCIKQSGTHHMYIEDFEVNEDGSLTLVTGS